MNFTHDPFPRKIEFQAYSICNANCVYCPVTKWNLELGKKGMPMSWEVLETILSHTKGQKIDEFRPHLDCEP